MKEFNGVSFALGCLLGAAMILCLAGLAVTVYWLVDREIPDPASNVAEMDRSAALSVEADGCIVSRSEVEGSSPIENLTWVVEDETGEQVLGRAAEGEHQYTYY